MCDFFETNQFIISQKLFELLKNCSMTNTEFRFATEFFKNATEFKKLELDGFCFFTE